MATQTLFQNQLENLDATSVGFLPGGPSGFISDPLSTDSQFNQSLFGSSSVNIASTTSGTLATTDPTNPTRSGSFRDDYLLTGVTVGQQVQVNLNASFDTYLQLVNADTGAVITYDDDSGEGFNSQLTFTVQAGIDYIVRATSYSSGVTGNYTLVTDYGSPTSGTPIGGNQRFSGTLATTDPANSLRSGSYYDGYYLTNLVAGQQVQVNLESTFDTYLQLVNADTGAVVAYDDDSGVGFNSQLTFTAQGGINYIVRATSYSAGVTGEYTLTTSSPFSLNGTLDSTDPTNPTRSGSLRDDYYLTNLVAGQQVQVNLNASFDTYLQVVNAATGAVITYDDDSGEGLNSQLTFTAQEGIDYILRATSYGSGVTGNYTLSTNFGAFTSGTPISGNQTFNGTLVNTDPTNTLRSGSYYDGYLLTNLIAGEQVQVNLNSSAFDSYLQVVNANTGEVVAFNDDFSGLNSQVTFTAQAGVDYIARATSYTLGATGAYTLTTTYTPAPTPNPSYNSSYGYGLVNAAAAVADALGQSPFADVPNLGGNNWGNDLVNAPEAWAHGYTGQGVVVAVIDSGVDITHEDLVNNIWTNSGEIAGNNIDDDGNGYIDDIHGWNFGVGQNNNNVMPGTTTSGQGHGTHVAGTIAAMNNGIGATGVAYNAEIMAIRMGDVSDDGYFTNGGSLGDAIRYAVNNGANVINMSLGWSDSTDLGNALAYAASHNVVVVSAAGNSGLSSPGVPASYATQHGIAVGAVDSTKTMAYFSNRAGSDSNMQYVVAPGVSVYSTLPGNTYASWDGTSMASPHVAGVAALILSANPNLTAAQVEHIITETANPTGITV